MKIDPKDKELVKSWQADWNKFAREALNVKLDYQQQEVLSAIQHNKRVTVRAGTARGKDFVAAVAAICALYLQKPAKVLLTAPTGHQAVSIMMAEVTTIINGAKIPLGGDVLTKRIQFTGRKDWFLEAFKADDTNTEAWSGFHSPNMTVIVTEASGVSETIFTAIEGLLQGNSRIVLIFNPNNLQGEAYQSTRSPRYKKMKLSDLDAPNVINYLRWKKGIITEEEYKKRFIPGQVDGEWVEDKVLHKGWCQEIKKENAKREYYDFEWLGKYYRPNDYFRVKVLGEFPGEDENTLIPLAWIEAANERWINLESFPLDSKQIGVDIAGDGRDESAFCKRNDEIVMSLSTYQKMEHMAILGKLITEMQPHTHAFIDAIGEGAGVCSRARELKKANIHAAKFSYSKMYKGLRDYTGEIGFANLRAYCYYAVRDWLNPAYDSKACLPPDEILTQELVSMLFSHRSDGKIIIEKKEKIKDKIGRSPDRSDSLALSFVPVFGSKTKAVSKSSLGLH